MFSSTITKRRTRILRDYIIGWILSFFFLSIVRGVGTEEIGSLEFGLIPSIILPLVLGPLLGLISGFAQVWMEERIYRRISILNFLLLRLLYALLFVIILIIIAFWAYRIFFGTNLNIIDFAFDEGTVAIYFFVISVDFLLNLLRQINLMLGQGNLSKLLRGKFYRPREEQRVFMFLDLQSSTQLAESLGHLKYSELIQDCFNDLGVVEEDGAQIYQYAGDEAVLTWDASTQITSSFANAYFRFCDQLRSKKSYYKEKYGTTPFFKAGAHCGNVAVTEIGKFKKEIAYHGDPVNTAARIQGKCNELGAKLLISDTLKPGLQGHLFELEYAGSIPLRGKSKDVELYSIKRKGLTD